MDQRNAFQIALDSGMFGMTELCVSYGISRKTGYKWCLRYEEGGVAALADRSRAPHSCPHQMSVDIADAIIESRHLHPSWGPRKLLVELARRRPELADRLPAVSSAGDLLKRKGLVHPRKRRDRAAHPGAGTLVAEAPNHVWCIDFKGEFKTGDGILCYPLTVTDAHSRYLLGCDGLRSTGHEGAQKAMRALFNNVGLPAAIRSDNGCPFCSNAIGGLSRLSIWWMKMGIRHDRIRPASPQENGRHERMHRTLKAETTRPPAENMLRQQVRFGIFRNEYNQIRPHEALGMQTPASIWVPSTRQMPERLPGPEYDGHMEIRTVRKNGSIKFTGKHVFISEVLAHERVGLEEVDDGIWSILFYNSQLARLDQRTMKLVTITPRQRNKVLPMLPV